MTGAAQPIEWYLARDNKQYGPLSDLELMKLVELRHLRDEDMVWRAGFTDWTPAQTAFPHAFARSEPIAELAPSPPAAPAALEPAAARPPAPMPAEPVPAAQPALNRQQALAANLAQRLAPELHSPAKIETLSDYRARQASRPDATGAPGPAIETAFDLPVATSGPSLNGEPARAAATERSQPATRRMWIAPAEVDALPTSGPAAGSAKAEPDPHRFHPRLDQMPVAPRPAVGMTPAPTDRAPAGFNGRQPAGYQSTGYQPNSLQSNGHQSGGQQVYDRPDPALSARGAMPAAANHRLPAARQSDDFDDDDGDDTENEPRRPRRIWGLVAILGLLALMAGGTWAALMHPQIITSPMRALGLVFGQTSGGAAEAQKARPTSAASRQSAANAASPLPAAALQGFPETPAALDEALQAGRLWQVVRAEFPEWYGERIKETARLVAEKKSDEAVTKHLIDALISLRRKNAEHAFQSSLPRLQLVARTFRDNLDMLSQHSQVACYALISSGEGSRGMVSLFRDPAYGPTLQTGLTAVFEAVAEGRRTPTNNLPSRRADYDLLTKELMALGWKDQDIDLFADAEALAKSPPEQVCRMVREWFTAHLAIEDKDVQLRLLVESVRPVVAG